MTATTEAYDASYYATSFGDLPYQRNDHWLAFFRSVAHELVRTLAPRTAFDAGCAMGMLVETFWDIGVEARGVDISEFAISQVRPDMRPFCTTGSVTDPVPGRYDVITCIEVLEHIEPADADRAIAAMTAATDAILFSSTPSDFAEPTHINVRPPIAWIRAFAKHGFRADLLFDATFLSPHAILFRRSAEYDPEATEELFAYHLMLRSALIEREQRLGKLQSDHAAARAALEADYARAIEDLARQRSIEAAAARHEVQRVRRDAEREQDRIVADLREGHRRSIAEIAQRHETVMSAAIVAADEARDRARTAAKSARLEVAAARNSEREAASLAASARVDLADQAEAIADAERREALASERLAASAAENAALRVTAERVADADAFDALSRQYTDLKMRFQRLIAADIALYESESERLSRF